MRGNLAPSSLQFVLLKKKKKLAWPLNMWHMLTFKAHSNELGRQEPVL